MPMNPLPTIPGSAPGIEHDELAALSTGTEAARIMCADYNPTHISVQEVDGLDDFLAHHRPEWSAVRWIHVDGLTEWNAVLAGRPVFAGWYATRSFSAY